MTLVLELPADVENQLRADAASAGVPLETLAFERLMFPGGVPDRRVNAAAIEAVRRAQNAAAALHSYTRGPLDAASDLDAVREGLE